MPPPINKRYDQFTTYSGRGNANKWLRSSKLNDTKLPQEEFSFKKLNNALSGFLSGGGIEGAISGGIAGIQDAISGGISGITSAISGGINAIAGDALKKIDPKVPSVGDFTAADDVRQNFQSASQGLNLPLAGAGEFTSADDARQNFQSNRLKNLTNTSSPNVFFNNPTGSNPLHNYETYNYEISFSCIGPSVYASNSFENNPGTLIAQSGGKGKQGRGVLGVDYYVERLSFRTVVTNSSDSPDTNAFSIIMNISEPYGVDLISAMVEASKQQGYDNHMNAVYLLGIRFQGHDNAGNPQNIPFGGRKFIPCKIYNVELDVDAGGGNYLLDAAPYNYTAKNSAYDEIPFNVTCNGTTVKEVIESFFNNHNRQLQDIAKKTSLGTPNTYELDVSNSESDILSSSLNLDEIDKVSAKQAINFSITGKGGAKAVSRKINVEKGESILKFLRSVIDNSAKFLERVDGEGKVVGESIPAPNIMTTTTISATNNGMGDQSYKFSYALRSQNRDISHIDGAQAPSEAAPVRIYDFLYTGNNKDILDFNLRYKFAYFQPALSQTEDGDNTEENNPKITGGYNPHTDSGTSLGQQFAGQSVGGSDKAVPSTVTPSRTARGMNLGNDSGDIVPDASSGNKESIEKLKLILEDPAADMINCELQILGDPYWIEQKTVRTGTKTTSQAGAYIEPDGSISVDGYEPIIQINAKLPTDINDANGLYNLTDTAFFQGRFLVYMCESSFEGGVFTQTLSLVRQKGQQRDRQKGGIQPNVSSSSSLSGILGQAFDRGFNIGDISGGTTPNVSKKSSLFPIPNPRRNKKLVTNQGNPINFSSGGVSYGGLRPNKNR